MSKQRNFLLGLAGAAQIVALTCATPQAWARATVGNATGPRKPRTTQRVSLIQGDTIAAYQVVAADRGGGRESPEADPEPAAGCVCARWSSHLRF